MADNRLGISLNLKRNAPAQWGGFNFNSMAVFNGQPLGANADGLFKLEDAETDNGTEIDSIVELVTTHLGAFTAKRLRKIYLGYETSGNLVFKVKTDDETEKTYTLTASKTGQLQHRVRLNATRDMKGVYWMFRIENTAGCDFSLDLIEALAVVLGLGRG